MHSWWPHLFSWPRAFDPISWWWLSAKGYALTSSWFNVAWIVALATWWLHTRCHNPRCVRKGRYMTADGHHKLCRRCHPDFPNHRLSLREIHLRHFDAKP